MFVNFILSVCSDFSSDAIHTAIGIGIGTLTRRNASSIIRLLSFSREKVKDSLAAVRDKSQPRAERAIRSFKGLSRVDQLYLVGAAAVTVLLMVGLALHPVETPDWATMPYSTWVAVALSVVGWRALKRRLRRARGQSQ